MLNFGIQFYLIYPSLSDNAWMLVINREPFIWRGGRCWYGPDMLTTLFVAGEHPAMTILPAHYFYPFFEQPEERKLAHRFFYSPAVERQRILEEIKNRFVDGEWPFAAHMWGMDGSSHAPTAGVL
jgi:hypothetical protein